VADVNKHTRDTDLLDTLSKRLVVGDGAMSRQLQAAGPSLDAVETKYVRLQSG
jgi:5-methyltetrahydrofolate--homocysteine methyltransferase